MKTRFTYIVVLLLAGLLGGACGDQRLEGYENNPGLYFYKRTIAGMADFQNDSITYSFFMRKDDIKRDTVWIDVRTMGLPEDVARPVNIVQVPVNPATDPVPGVHYVGFDDPAIAELTCVQPGAVQCRFPVIVLRDPSLKKAEFRLHMAIRSNEYFSVGLPEQSEFMVKFADKPIQPTNWDSQWYHIFGSYDDNKLWFIINYVGITNFDETEGIDAEMSDFLNATAIHALEKYNKENNTILMQTDGVTPVEF